MSVSQTRGAIGTVERKYFTSNLDKKSAPLSLTQPVRQTSRALGTFARRQFTAVTDPWWHREGSISGLQNNQDALSFLPMMNIIHLLVSRIIASAVHKSLSMFFGKNINIATVPVLVEENIAVLDNANL